MKIRKGDVLHCNRCNEMFKASVEGLTREGFCSEKSTRVNEPSTCPNCDQTDWHWVFATDVMPVFEGSFEKRRKAERKWLSEN